jgi:hypothetical protein
LLWLRLARGETPSPGDVGEKYLLGLPRALGPSDGCYRTVAGKGNSASVDPVQGTMTRVVSWSETLQMSLSASRVFPLIASGLLTALPLSAADVTLENDAGVEVVVQKTPQGYALGRISLNGEPVETPLSDGMIRLLDTETTPTG